VFPVVRGVPVLLRHDNEVFPIEAYLRAPPPRGRLRALASTIIPTPSLAPGYRRHLLAFARELAGFDPADLLVIGAGQQQAWLRELFRRCPNVRVTCCDVDARAAVDLFCDAHELPFPDATFHGVLATAVLEHVLYPERVVAEVGRVLANGGAVYSEIPFMQQVHEGAYDFTRYTLSGHRRLFNQFEEVASGVVAGPGTALVWAIEHFVVCFAPGRTLQLAARAVCRVLFFWLKYFDLVLRSNPAAADGASGTYFLGRKRPSAITSDKAIVERYVGAGRLRHV
jgi:SAM-dependent methyltransferase